MERPKVIYNASTGTYVMYMHIDSTNYSEAKVGVATSSIPCGPYTYRGSSRPMGNLSRDLGLFQNTDGTGYLLSEDRNNGLRIYKLSADYLSVDSAVTVLGGSGIPAEGVHTLKNVNSSMLMDVSSGSTANGAKIIQWPSNGGANQQWTCNGGTNQQWALDLTGSYTGSNYMLVGVGSGLTIGVAGSTAQGAAVDQELGGSASANSETWTFS